MLGYALLIVEAIQGCGKLSNNQVVEVVNL